MPKESANDYAEEPPRRELSERLAVRLMVIAEQCEDPATQYRLRELVDQYHSSRIQLDQAYAELNIVQDFIPAGSSNRPGKRLVPTAITIHNTDAGDVGADAAAHAKYQKSADARKRKVSWHFTVDDQGVYQSLPINEIGWHTGKTKGDAASIGIEVCMNADLDAPAAYRRAALLTAVLARQNGIDVPKRIFQHYDWSKRNCPRVLRATPGGWQGFLAQIEDFRDKLTSVPAATIVPNKVPNHHLLD
ncbi:MAG TPA: peptidoglycan recognition family protein [Xanthobacteraceae bacterium]